MRSSIFPTRQATRVCAFCRQQLQQQRITTSRSLHASPAQQQQQQRRVPSSTPVPKSPNTLTNHAARTTGTARRPFTNSAHVRSDQPSAEVDAGTDADAQGKPRVPQTHYELFPKTLPAGPPPGGPFAIDVMALRREFLALQARAHPDRHPGHLKARAQATSARINEAFRTLAFPLPRAQYLLSLRGLDVAGDETARVEDPALLALVLETRELIDDARHEVELEAPRAENEARIRDTLDRLDALFAADDLEGAKAETVKLRYWTNIKETIDSWEKGKPAVLRH